MMVSSIAAMASSSSSSSSYNVLFRGTELLRSDGFGASLPRYQGRRHSTLAGSKLRGFLSTSGSKAMSTCQSICGSEREKDPKKRVVITGMGITSVFGNEVDVFYEKLVNGESGVRVIDKFDASDLPVRFGALITNFNYTDAKSEEQQGLVEDCWSYFMASGKRALQDSNLGPQVLQNMDRKRIGVIVGTGTGGRETLSNGIEKKEFCPYWMPNMGSALFAIENGLMGVNYTISTGCASATTSFCAAADHIRNGQADIMVVGGTEAVCYPGVAGLVASGALSKRNNDPQRASRPWDKNRDGFVLGEGAAVLIMENLETALKRGAKIVAEYLGGAMSFDAHHITNPRPDGDGVSTCIANGLQDARVSPQEVNYINCHATSTRAGDLAEIRAIKNIFKDTSHMKINSTKSMIGHASGASGALEAIATIKAINTGWLHPTINQDELEDLVTIDTVPNVKKKHQVNVAISNSFGFGGHNAVVVFAPFIS